MTTPYSARFSRNLSLLAFAPLALAIMLLLVGQAVAKPVEARVGMEGNQIILRAIDRTPADARSARRTYDRIDAAALEVCGGGSHSFAEVNRTVRHSDCWRQAMRTALAQTETPYWAARTDDAVPARP